MEILVFGLLAMRNGYRQPQETVVGEPHQLQPLDVRTLAKDLKIIRWELS